MKTKDVIQLWTTGFLSFEKHQTQHSGNTYTHSASLQYRTVDRDEMDAVMPEEPRGGRGMDLSISISKSASESLSDSQVSVKARMQASLKLWL